MKFTILILFLVAMIAIQGTYAAICARDNKTGKYETLDSLEDMYSRNANGGRFVFLHEGSC